MISTNLSPIFQRFQDIVFDRSKITIFGYPSFVRPPMEGFLWVDLRKFFLLEVNGWLSYQTGRNIAENFNCLSMVHKRYRRQTDGRRHIYFTFVKIKHDKSAKKTCFINHSTALQMIPNWWVFYAHCRWLSWHRCYSKGGWVACVQFCKLQWFSWVWFSPGIWYTAVRYVTSRPLWHSYNY